MKITTHILDTSRGKTAAGVIVTLEYWDGKLWSQTAKAVSNGDGRVADWSFPLRVGIYRLTFETGEYFRSRNTPTLYPSISVTFNVDDANAHYHIPLLLSPHGYSTYRGS